MSYIDAEKPQTDRYTIQRAAVSGDYILLIDSYKEVRADHTVTMRDQLGIFRQAVHHQMSAKSDACVFVWAVCKYRAPFIVDIFHAPLRPICNYQALGELG